MRARRRVRARHNRCDYGYVRRLISKFPKSKRVDASTAMCRADAAGRCFANYGISYATWSGRRLPAVCVSSGIKYSNVSRHVSAGLPIIQYSNSRCHYLSPTHGKNRFISLKSQVCMHGWVIATHALSCGTSSKRTGTSTTITNFFFSCIFWLSTCVWK